MKKDLTPEELRRFDQGNERLLDAITREAIADVKKVHRDFIARLEARLREVAVSSSDLAADAERYKLLRDIASLLDDALGKRGDDYKFLRDYRRLAKKAEARALQYFALFGTTATLGRTGRVAMRLLLTEQTDLILQRYDERLRRPVLRAIRAETFGLQGREASIASVVRAGRGLSTVVVEQAIAEGFRNVHRATNKLAAANNSQLDVRIFRGPDDGKICKVCRSIFDLGEQLHGARGVFLASEVAAGMVPGLTGDPQIEGGHPNCRHRWNAVTKRYARERLGADFGDD